MKGKKSDSIFVSEFIQESIENGATSADEIVKRAKCQIEKIDEEIKLVEIKKIKRSKLLDVVGTFEKINKDKSEDAKFLPFFQLQYPKICEKICSYLKQYKLININSSKILDVDVSEFNFSVKQLIESKILYRKDDDLIFGNNYIEYMKFIHCEDK